MTGRLALARRSNKRAEPAGKLTTLQRRAIRLLLRRKELRWLCQGRWGYTLPNNAAGRRAARVMAEHYPADNKRAINWLEVNAPWLTAIEVERLLRTAPAKWWVAWSNDRVGKYLGVTDDEREYHAARGHRFMTITACDKSPAERKALAVVRKRERDRQQHQDQRRKQGVKPRAEWLKANSASQDKPWQAAGLSRRTW
jgi:hypothetical protein